MRVCGYMLAVLLVAIMAVACGPGRYVLDLEMMRPSKAGVDLAGKNVTVVYGQEGVYPNDIFLESMAGSFAQNIKDEYQGAIGDVTLCRLESATLYASRDSMLNLLMKTGADAVFLLDKIDFKSSSFSFVLRCYDAMNQEDKVQLFSASSVAESMMGNEQVKAEGVEAGKEIAAAFEPQWIHEQYSLYYFESSDWYSALEKAEAFDWKGAMNIWLNLLQTNDPLKRASASYNIATACYMMGDYHLAALWLDNADRDADLVVSAGLRKRINARLQ
jgi:hypothetical protein